MGNGPPIVRGFSGAQPPVPGAPATDIEGATGKAADPQYPDNVIYFDPSIGASAGNIFKTWAEIVAAVLALPALTEIRFVGSCTIPSGGPYDVTLTQWSTGGGIGSVAIADGATFTGIPTAIDGGLTVICDSTSSPFSSATTFGFSVGLYCTIKSNAGKAELFDVSGSAQMIMFGGALGTVGDGINPVIELADTAKLVLEPNALGNFTISDSAVEGSASTDIRYPANWPSLYLGDQSGTFAGTISKGVPLGARGSSLVSNPFRAETTTPINLADGDRHLSVRVNAAAVVNFPTAVDVGAGYKLTIKDALGVCGDPTKNITLVPDIGAGDTIDNASSRLMNVNLQRLIAISDGVNNWEVG